MVAPSEIKALDIRDFFEIPKLFRKMLISKKDLKKFAYNIACTLDMGLFFWVFAMGIWLIILWGSLIVFGPLPESLSHISLPYVLVAFYLFCIIFCFVFVLGVLYETMPLSIKRGPASLIIIAILLYGYIIITKTIPIMYCALFVLSIAPSILVKITIRAGKKEMGLI